MTKNWRKGRSPEFAFALFFSAVSGENFKDSPF
jgi:hypothetical protein